MTFNVKYVGDLSRADAWILAHHGWKAGNILEFGAGASTQIFAQCKPSVLVTVETDQKWIDRTKQNIAALKVETVPLFVDFCDVPSMQYDVIFVDGVWHRREEFAFEFWKHLDENGVMIFHDTRRDFDIANVASLLQEKGNEIKKILVNHHAENIQTYEMGPSNCTLIYKRPPLEYQNWNEVEEKEPWMWGDGEPKSVELWPRV